MKLLCYIFIYIFSSNLLALDNENALYLSKREWVIIDYDDKKLNYIYSYPSNKSILIFINNETRYLAFNTDNFINPNLIIQIILKSIDKNRTISIYIFNDKNILDNYKNLIEDYKEILKENLIPHINIREIEIETETQSLCLSNKGEINLVEYSIKSKINKNLKAIYQECLYCNKVNAHSPFIDIQIAPSWWLKQFFPIINGYYCMECSNAFRIDTDEHCIYCSEKCRNKAIIREFLKNIFGKHLYEENI